MAAEATQVRRSADERLDTRFGGRITSSMEGRIIPENVADARPSRCPKRHERGGRFASGVRWVPLKPARGKAHHG
jgi:hypothetical protein